VGLLQRSYALMPRLPADLLSRENAELRETHISWVLLTESDVYKLKKPVNFGFLDYTSLEKRRQACMAEVTLNSRLAQGVYQGVVPITQGSDGHYRIGKSDDGDPIVDWAVHMKRLPDSRRGDALLEAGQLQGEQILAVAQRLAEFHAQARADRETAGYGSIDCIRFNVKENFDQTRKTLSAYLDPAEAASLESWQLGFLERKAGLFKQRIEQGRIRDGHGDLRLDQMYFLDRPPGIAILDCIEFNERFRFSDTACDLAFLSMDLRFHGRSDFAERLLAHYARESNDFDLYKLIDFYESYRAFVRGKVHSFQAHLGQAHRCARDFFRLALLNVQDREPKSKAVIAVGGMIASGKSTVAEALSAALAYPIVDTDRTRKSLLGVPPERPLHHAPWLGAYDATTSQRVYAECLRRASVVLESGRSVIIDASFRSREMRGRARELAQSHGAQFVFLECRLPPEISRARLLIRERQTGVSDGRIAIFDEFAARFESVTELPDSEHLIIDTSRPIPGLLPEILPRILARIPLQQARKAA